jgi:hypothetical protein
VDLPARVEVAASAGFDPARAAAMARNLAPTATDAAHPDRLTLFAALLLYDPRIARRAAR